MANIILITLVVIAGVLVVVALLVWRRQKEEIPEGISAEQMKAFFTQWIMGLF